jgi:hypothetical protein
MIDKQALLDPINFLVLDASAPKHYKAMMEVAKLPPTVPVKLTAESAVLNPLLTLYHRDPAAFNRVMHLVDTKREARGWEPLVEPESKGFDRKEYQREFMFQKRSRSTRLAAIENSMRPERDQIRGNARLEFMRVKEGLWKARRDLLLDAARKEHGGTITKEQTKALLEGFWAQVDAELDEMEYQAKSKIRGW